MRKILAQVELQLYNCKEQQQKIFLVKNKEKAENLLVASCIKKTVITVTIFTMYIPVLDLAVSFFSKKCLNAFLFLDRLSLELALS